MAQANSATYPGLDIINFDFSVAPAGLGPKPTITATNTLNVTEGVHIFGANGNDYVTIDGARPFDFSHLSPAPGPLGDPTHVPAVDSRVDQVTFSKCSPPANEPANDQIGGAIRLTGGSLTLNTVRFLDNSAPRGGAVFVGHYATLVVDGIAAGPLDYHPLQGQPRTLFKGNKALLGDGGGIEVEGTAELRRAWFVQNEATGNGGGMSVRQSGMASTPSVLAGEVAVTPDVRFVGNKAFGLGGGVCFDQSGASELTSVVFSNNEAGTFGGGFAVSRTTVTLVGGSVEDNRAPQGAGGYVVGSGFLTPGIVNASGVSFSGNVDLADNPIESVLIADWGVLNTSGCAFNGWAPVVLAGTNGEWNTDPLNPDTP